MSDRDAGPFESASLTALRARTSEKWAVYPPAVLPAWVAEMDFPLAPPIRVALERAIADGDCGYAAPGALAPAFAAFAAERYRWAIDERQIFAVPDVMAGVAQAIHLLTSPGDGVAISSPVYPPFFETIAYAGRRVVDVPLQFDGTRWSLDDAALERAFAEVKAYLLCSPHNPVGRVWSSGELRAIAALAERYGVALVADEIHAPLTMPRIPFTPLLAVASPQQPVVALHSASKAWNVPGLKCGVLVAGAGIAGAMRARLESIPTEILSRVGHLGVVASVAAFRDGGEWLEDLRAYLDGNRHLLGELLVDYVPGARYVAPEATYLAWIDCSGVRLRGEPAAYFLKHGRVALYRGSSFGAGSERWVRLNFGTSRTVLREIVARMATALGAYDAIE